MFRATNLALNYRVLLHRYYPINVQVACISRLPPLQRGYKPEERETCPKPPPPPPPKPPDERLFWGTLTLCVLAGVFTAYAKESPEVRDWLSINAPWFDDFIAIVYQENLSYKEFASKCVEDVKEYLSKIGNGQEETKPKQCSLDGKPVEVPDKTVILDSGGPETGEICKIIPPPITTRDICEIEKCLGEFCETIIINYITARDACACYNKEVEEVMEDFNMKKLERLHATKEERIELVTESMENIEKAKAKLEELNHYFECGVQAPKEKMDFTRGRIKDCRDKMSIVDAEFQWQNDKSLALDDLWSRVEAMMLKYTEETTTLIPGVDYNAVKPAMSGDPDLLLYHTFRYIKKLEGEVAEAAAGMTERVNRGMETLPACDPKVVKARNNALTSALNARRKELARDDAKRLSDQKARNDKALQDATKKQLERHNETMKIRLEQKEKETTVKLNKLVAEQVAKEKKNFKNQLTEMARKLKIVEDKLNGKRSFLLKKRWRDDLDAFQRIWSEIPMDRDKWKEMGETFAQQWDKIERLKAERETRRSQELWTAGASLLAATKKGDPIVNVNKEIKAIEKASGDGDKLVQTVLNAIPASVKENGIVPESVLKERYRSMETVAMRVALVESDGAPLPVYLLSLMQSIFLFMRLSGIPREEIEQPPQEPPKYLDTFDLLQRARYWIQRGNLAIAIRYVNALQGASRAAAAWWYEAAREHVETRQAAEAVLAHAAALGLQYI